MSTQRMEGGEFSLIITDVDKSRLDQASKDFAAAFSLDEAIAIQIVKSAPIIFAQKLSKGEVKAITSKLTELSTKGLEFRVTARVAQKIPKVNWPVRPQFTAAGSAGPNGLAFEWDNNAFVCPTCGETFLFRRLGKLKLVEPPPEPKGAAPTPTPMPVAAMTPKAAPALAAVDELGFADSATEVPMEGQLEGVEGGEPIIEPEPLDIPETLEEVSSFDAGPAASAEPPAAEDGSAEIRPPDETATPEVGGEFSTAVDEAAPAPVVEAAAPPVGELYNVFLSKITETSKRDKAAELISKIKGCSQQEAKDLTTRLVIPLAKNVGKAQAEEILNQFKRLKIFGRMTKVR